MNEFYLAASAIVIVAAAIHSFTRKKRKKVPATTYLARVLDGKADLAGVQAAATMVGNGVKRYADKLNRPPLFLRACGDLYEDFFPPKPPDPTMSAKAQANSLMAAYIRRYRDASLRKPDTVSDVNMFNLCEGAGYGLATFRCLSRYIPDMVFLADSLGPKPNYEERDAYAAYYREAGRLTSVPLDLLESSLSIRLGGLSRGRQQEVPVGVDFG